MLSSTLCLGQAKGGVMSSWCLRFLVLATDLCRVGVVRSAKSYGPGGRLWPYECERKIGKIGKTGKIGKISKYRIAVFLFLCTQQGFDIRTACVCGYRCRTMLPSPHSKDLIHTYTHVNRAPSASPQATSSQWARRHQALIQTRRRRGGPGLRHARRPHHPSLWPSLSLWHAQ